MEVGTKSVPFPELFARPTRLSLTEMGSVVPLSKGLVVDKFRVVPYESMKLFKKMC